MISIVILAPVDPTFQSLFVTSVFMSWYLGWDAIHWDVGWILVIVS